MEESQLSIRVVSGSLAHSIIRIKGVVHIKEMVILVDSRSTHSFVDARVVKDVRFPMAIATPIQVTVANDSRRLSQAVCEGFT